MFHSQLVFTMKESIVAIHRIDSMAIQESNLANKPTVLIDLHHGADADQLRFQSEILINLFNKSIELFVFLQLTIPMTTYPIEFHSLAVIEYHRFVQAKIDGTMLFSFQSKSFSYS